MFMDFSALALDVYGIFQLLWDSTEPLWFFFTHPIIDTYLEFVGTPDQFTEAILNSIGRYTPLEFMIGAMLIMVLIRPIIRMFLPFG